MYGRKIMLALATCAIALALNDSILAKNVTGYGTLAGDRIAVTVLLTDVELVTLDKQITGIPHMPGGLKMRLADASNGIDRNIPVEYRMGVALLLTDAKLVTQDAHIPPIPHMLGRLRFPDRIKAGELISLPGLEQIHRHVQILGYDLVKAQLGSSLLKGRFTLRNLKDSSGGINQPLPVAMLGGKEVLANLTGIV
ncbi:MAG: hypothetical protein WBP93_03970 [Pyrinomonadaceae bacterium]